MSAMLRRLPVRPALGDSGGRSEIPYLGPQLPCLNDPPLKRCFRGIRSGVVLEHEDGVSVHCLQLTRGLRRLLVCLRSLLLCSR